MPGLDVKKLSKESEKAIGNSLSTLLNQNIIRVTVINKVQLVKVDTAKT